MTYLREELSRAAGVSLTPRQVLATVICDLAWGMSSCIRYGTAKGER